MPGVDAKQPHARMHKRTVTYILAARSTFLATHEAHEARELEIHINQFSTSREVSSALIDQY